MSCGKLILRVAQYLPLSGWKVRASRSVRVFRWVSVYRLSFYTVKSSKDVPCFMEAFVNSSTGGVSFLSGVSSGFRSTFFGICFVCVCVCVCVCARGVCVRPGARLYIHV